MQKIFLVTHRWFGITVGFYFVLLGLTGSYLVYRDPLQKLFNSEIRVSSGRAGKLDLALSVAAAQKALQVKSLPSLIVVNKNADQNIEIGFSGLANMGRGVVTTFVDPATHQFHGKEIFRHTFGGKIFVFHHDLFWGRAGRTIMAIAGLAMLFLLMGGLYLWWPRRTSWKKALRLGPMNNPVQANLQLHKFFGLHTLILMIMVTFTGVYLSRPDWFQKRSLQPRQESDSSTPELTTLDFGKLTQLVEASAKPVRIRISTKKATVHIQDGQGAFQLYSAKDFTILEIEKPKPKDMRAIQHDLHAGHFWGWFGEFLVFLSGLLPMFFYISGFYVWYQKSKARKNSFEGNVVNA